MAGRQKELSSLKKKFNLKPSDNWPIIVPTHSGDWVCEHLSGPMQTHAVAKSQQLFRPSGDLNHIYKQHRAAIPYNTVYTNYLPYMCIIYKDIIEIYKQGQFPHRGLSIPGAYLTIAVLVPALAPGATCESSRSPLTDGAKMTFTYLCINNNKKQTYNLRDMTGDGDCLE